MSLPTPYYQSDRCTLYCGDARSIVPKLWKPDVVLADPPYGINYSSGHGSEEWGDGAIEGDEDTSVRDSVLMMLTGVPAFVFGTWKRPAPIGTRAVLVWDTLGALGMGDLRIPWKPAHQQIYVMGDPNGFCGERGTDVIRFPPVQSMAKNGRLHPFEKPVGLLFQLLQKTRGATVIDPFCGVGSSGVAAMQAGRKFIGIEIDEKYCAITKRRIKEAEEVGQMFREAAPQQLELLPPHGGE